VKFSGDYTAETENNIVKIIDNSENRDVNSIRVIWIEKSKGLIKFELDDRIWTIK